ncbi:hypothetical protein DPMN_176724 [Dreissena polymorpha]|uniref:Uncharacterized protein n=1 Tax=Dreissena polymorpha TaxID=45954 RepID=A0A9D4IKW5_DREPO|nr:hypothetical protein DPMN_176724 [Dreissena polymorpha]
MSRDEVLHNSYFTYSIYAGGTGQTGSGGSMVIGTNGGCHDVRQNCADYTTAVCTNPSYNDWVQSNCAHFCNKCGGSVNGHTGTCSDKISNCATYAADVCTKHDLRAWATENCAGYCNLCGGTGTESGGTMTGTGGTITGTGGTIIGGGTMTGGGTCQDKIPNCVSYAADVCTSASYKVWATENCASYCHLCGGSMTGTGGTGTGSGGTMTGTGGTITGGGTMTGTGGTITATCYDKMPTCADYGPSVCSDVKFTDWVLTNCPAFCHKCSSGTMTGTGGTGGTMTGTGGTGGTMTGTGTITGTGTGTGGGGYVSTCGGACHDTINNCDTYAADVCTSSDFRQWAIEHCACHCHLCGTGGTMTGSGGTMTGTGGTGTGTGGTMTGTGGTGTGTGGTMTGTGGTGTGTGGTMTGTGGTGGTGSGTITGTGGSGIMESGTCYDKLSTCATYAADVCTIYTQWAKENCAYHCHLCASGTMTGTGGTMTGTGTGTGGGMTGGNGTIVCIGTCMDKIPNCAAYAADVCTRPDFKAWATENCGCHCHLCSSGTGGTMTGTGGTMTGTGGTIIGTGTGTGSGMTGQLSGCVYNGQAYTQGQTWTSGCKFSCQCVDASSGKYQCQELCVTWALPPQCTLNPPAAGKCCSTPNCPAGFNIQYPPGYVEN